MKQIDFLNQTYESYHSYYKMYRAAHCRATGLPLYDHKTAGQMVADRLYSKTRAKKENVEIDETVCCGWYRMQNGYVPLFKPVSLQ